MNYLFAFILFSFSFGMKAQSLLEQSTTTQIPTFSPENSHYQNQNSALRFAPTHRLDSFISTHIGTSSNGTDTKIVYEYNIQGQPTKIEEYRRSMSNPQWGIYQRETWSYDTNNQIIDYFRMYLWDPAINGFVFGDRIENSYVNGNLHEETVSFFSNQNWDYLHKKIYAYNLAGAITEIISFGYFAGQWNTTLKDVYRYDTANLLDRIETLLWNGGSYEDGFNKVYFYNGNNQIIQTITLQYFFGDWENYEKFEMAYDPTGLLASVERYDANQMVWEADSKEEYYYDNSMNLTNKTVAYWPYNGSAWEYDKKETYTHDDNHPYADLISPFEERNCKHRLLTYLQEDYSNTNQWEQEQDGIYYWSEILMNNSDNSPEVITVSTFPNPATDVLNFELPITDHTTSIELYNAMGQLVLRNDLTNNTLQLPELPAGFYTYNMKQGKQIASGKVMIE